MQTEMVHRISKTHLFLQDEIINLDDLTELSDPSIFSLEPLPTKSYENKIDVQLAITIEMNLNERVVARDGYKLLDYFSDIGGIQGLLISGGAYLLAIWNHNNLDNFLLTRLYRLASSKNGSASEALVAKTLSNPVDYCCYKLPKKMNCCRESRHSRGFA